MYALRMSDVNKEATYLLIMHKTDELQKAVIETTSIARFSRHIGPSEEQSGNAEAALSAQNVQLQRQNTPGRRRRRNFAVR